MVGRRNQRHYSRWPKAFAWLSVLALVAAALLMAGAGPAYRWQWVGLGEAFNLLRNGVYAATAAVALSVLVLLISAFTRRGGTAIVAIGVLMLTAALLYMPWQQWQRAQQAPVIHDITTDMQSPPAFEALADARQRAPNGVAYPGETTAQQQRAAYPNVLPLVIDEPPQTVLAAAQAEAEEDE